MTRGVTRNSYLQGVTTTGGDRKRAPKGDPVPTPQLAADGSQATDAKGRLRWRLRYTHPITRKRMEAKYAGTERAAGRELERLITAASGGQHLDAASRRTTLTAYAPEWVAGYKARAIADGLARSTWMEHVGNVDRYILPTVKRLGWDSQRLSDYTADHVATLAASAQGTRVTTLSPSMQASVIKTLRLLFATAVSEGLIPQSPAAKSLKPWGAQPLEGYVPSAAEVQAVADRMAAYQPARRGGGVGPTQERLGAMVTFLAFTGLRVAEALALQVADVDLGDSEVRVTKQATVAGGRRAEKDRLKTRAGSRSLPLLPQAEPAAEHLIAYARRVGSGYLFAGSKRGDTPPKSIGYGVLRRHFAAAVLAAYKEGEAASADWTLHDLRHFFATTMLESGQPPHLVARWMGHSSPAVTLAVYDSRVQRNRTHEAREIGRDVARMLDPDAPQY